jgi:regulator of replication initiation timing
MTDKTKKNVIAVLILLLAGLGIYSFLNHKKQSDTINDLTIEKQEIIAELDQLKTQYDDAIAQNTTLSSELEQEKQRIEEYIDSLKKLKSTNRKTILFYKNKIQELTKKTQRLMVANDSLAKKNRLLMLENQDLEVLKDSLSENLQQQHQANDTLLRQNKDLSVKVAIASQIRANSYTVATFDKRKSGKFKPTDKARRVNVFKLSFNINENPLAEERDVPVYVVVKAPNGDVLGSKGFFTSANDNRIEFTDKTEVPFNKNAVVTDVIMDFDNLDLKKGDYIIEVYIDGRKTKVIKKTLR